MRFLPLVTLSLPFISSALIFQAPPVSAQGPSARPSEIPFHKVSFDVAREGHVALSWDEIQDAASYEITDAKQRNHYRGAFPNAFISGLSDGRHQFSLTAYNDAQQVIASSRIPAELTVDHWSLQRALTLFFIGLAVFIAIIAVIIIGSWISPIETTSTASQAAETT